MARTARTAPGKMVYHVLNRGVGKNKLFYTDDDYLAFERVIADTLDKRVNLTYNEQASMIRVYRLVSLKRPNGKGR